MYIIYVLCMYIMLVLKLIVLQFERHQYMNPTINIVSLKNLTNLEEKVTLKGKPKSSLVRGLSAPCGTL